MIETIETWVFSIVVVLCLLITVIGAYLTKNRQTKTPQMSYDPSIDKIDNNSNPNKGEEFPKEKLDECARMNVSDYNTLWKNG